MKAVSRVIREDRLGVRVEDTGIITIEQKRFGGGEGYVTLTTEDFEEIAKLLKELS